MLLCRGRYRRRRASADTKDANRGDEDHGDRQRHAGAHRIDKCLGEDGVGQPLQLLRDLRRDAGGELQAAARLAAPHLETTARRLAEAFDEARPERVGQLRRVADGMLVQAGGKPRVGVIVAAGEILDGDQPPGTVGGESTARLIRAARLDKDLKALVLRVDSPGGSVLASEQIYRELLALRAAGKPVVVSMSGYAASGGYYISAPADEIWASPATLTGSIGIFAIIPTVDRTLGKIGVSVDGVGTTPLSGQLRFDRPLGEEARALLQSQISRGYDEFLARVASGRNKTHEQVDAIAQGRVWAGADAHRLGLVDQLGSFNDAVKAAARRAKLTDYAPEFLEPEHTWAQELALQLKSRAAQALFRAAPGELALREVAQRFDPLTREVERLSRFSVPNRLYAYCFCETR